MKRLTLTYLFLLLLPCFATAQKPPRNRAATQQEQTAMPVSYDSLVVMRQELTTQERELEKQLNETRKLFSTDNPNQERIGAKIVELENQLFAVREQSEQLTAEISLLEQAQGFSIATIQKDSATTPAVQRAMLVENDYFRNNLPDADYRMLLSAQKQELAVEEQLKALKENYDQLTLLLPAYYIAPKGTQSDTLFSRIESLAEENEVLSDSVGEVWSSIFDTKIYSYNYILDKSGETEVLAEQERQMNNLLMLENEIEAEVYMYDPVAKYALQKLLIMGYEVRIADIAGLTAAADSLSRLTLPTSHINDYFLSALDTRERMFYDFANVELMRPAKYTNSNQIPQVEIFPRGQIYRILLGTYTRVQNISVFKGAYPMSREVKSDNKYYYYAGGYATYAEAEAAVTKLKRQGLPNARVVVWNNGVYNDNPGSATTTVTSDKKRDDRVRYRVEISNAGESLSRVVRDVIANQAAGKELSRIIDPATGEALFIVGSFTNKALAESLVNDIASVEPKLSIKISSVQ